MSETTQMDLGQSSAEKDGVTTREIEERIASAFSAPNWHTLFQVRNDGGFNADRTCDAMAVGLWPSSGHKLLGFEIKVSRADWLRELKDPWKAEAFAKFCDEWWLVIPRADMVKPGELPEGWGVMVPHSSGLKRAHHAKAREKVEPLERGLFAAMMKRASTMESKEIQSHFDRGMEAGQKTAHADYKYKVERIAELETAIKDFKEASGIDPLGGWKGAAKIGAAVKFVLDGGINGIRRDLERIDSTAETIRKNIAALALPETGT